MTGQSDTPQPAWFAEAEALKTRVLDRLERMPPEERCLPPRPGQWSAAQVSAHLVLVEECLVEDWYTATKANPAARPTLKSAMTAGMAGFAMRNTPIRVPTIAALDPTEREPNESGELRALAERWGAVRGRLADTVPPDASSLWIIHPVFGPLSCRQFGACLVAHLYHHLRHWPGKTADK